MKNRKDRNYFLTIYKLFDIKTWKLVEPIKYAILCNETCPKTLRKHIHAYIELKSPTRFSTVKKIFNNVKIHVEARIGTALQTIEYCKKDGDFVEYGKHTGQGHRSDLETISHKILIEGQNLGEIIETHTPSYIRYHKGIEKVRGYALRKMTTKFRKIETTVFWGKPGTGKTRSAVEYCTTNKFPYYKLNNAKNLWFDGYDGEKVLIIDEFTGWIDFSQLLNMLDGYQLRLEVKGSFTYANWDIVFITSNIHPHEWYKNLTSIQYEALSRRIGNIKEFK